jgi:hypothetical protein
MVLKEQEEIKRKQQKLKWTDELKSKAAFTHYPLFQWYQQSKEILLNLNMKC